MNFLTYILIITQEHGIVKRKRTNLQPIRLKINDGASRIKPRQAA